METDILKKLKDKKVLLTLFVNNQWLYYSGYILEVGDTSILFHDTKIDKVAAFDVATIKKVEVIN